MIDKWICQYNITVLVTVNFRSIGKAAALHAFILMQHMAIAVAVVMAASPFPRIVACAVITIRISMIILLLALF